jgi:hypothetical protein
MEMGRVVDPERGCDIAMVTFLEWRFAVMGCKMRDSDERIAMSGA